MKKRKRCTEEVVLAIMRAHGGKTHHGVIEHWLQKNGAPWTERACVALAG